MALFSYGLEFSGPVCDPSPQPNRLCCLDDKRALIVNGRDASILSFECLDISASSYKSDDGNVIKAPFVRSQKSAVARCDTHDRNPHRVFQSCVSRSSSIVYASDSAASLTIIQQSQSESAEEAWSAREFELPVDSYLGGWSGIASTSDGNAVVAHYMSKTLRWIDVETARVSSSRSPLHHPTALSGINLSAALSGLVILAEGSALSVWDSRTAENGECFRHLDISIACN
jgi:hypothetical protein